MHRPIRIFNSPGSDPLFCASLRSSQLYHIDSICQKVGSALLWIRNISAIGKCFSAPISDSNAFLMASHLLGWTCALIIAITTLSFRLGGWFSKNFHVKLCLSFVISLLELRAAERSLGMNMLHFVEEIEFEKSNLRIYNGGEFPIISRNANQLSALSHPGKPL